MTDETRNRRNVALLFLGGLTLSLLILFSPIILGIETARFGMIFLGATLLFLTVTATTGLWSRYYIDRPQETGETATTDARMASDQWRQDDVTIRGEPLGPGEVTPTPPPQPAPDEPDRRAR